MKVLDSYLHPLLLALCVGCSSSSVSQKDSKSTKLLFFDRPGYWDINTKSTTIDGLKIADGPTTHFFFINITQSSCFEEGSGEISFHHQAVLSDNMLINETVLSSPADQLTPVYWLNTLQAFEYDSNYCGYFFCSLVPHIEGLDPHLLVMYIMYKSVLYKFTGLIPIHQDWPWKESYVFNPDEHLSQDYPELFEYIILIWETQISDYQAKFESLR